MLLSFLNKLVRGHSKNISKAHYQDLGLLKAKDQGLAHITYVLETNCFIFQWHMARLLPYYVKRCWIMQTHIWSSFKFSHNWET